MENVSFTKDLLKTIDGSDHTYVFGPVLVPDEVDHQGHKITKEEIEKTAHLFMEEYRNVGLNHKKMISSDMATFVESYVSKSDFEFGDYPSGTWFLGTKVYDTELRQRILSGEIAAYSIGGVGVLTPVRD